MSRKTAKLQKQHIKRVEMVAEPATFIYNMHMMAYFRYCPGCRNDVSEVVRAGEKLKDSKKKSKMASASSSSQRDWGKVSFPDTFTEKT